jgi:hypothetical protein
MFRIATLAAVFLVKTAAACHANTTGCVQVTELAAARVRWGIRTLNSPMQRTCETLVAPMADISTKR